MSMSRQIGYCTNVHANANLQRTRENLAEYAVAVKEIFAPNSPMGIGLWLSAQAANELLEDATSVSHFGESLRNQGLVPFTFNGFPYGDFHQRVVKHRVYQPTWADSDRLAYTLNLVKIMDGLLPAGKEGSISTLPIAWPEPTMTEQHWSAITSNLIELSESLARFESESGRLIHVCLEPEPGCLLQRSQDVIEFFENRLLSQPAANEDHVRRYLRVCHDICHAVVMFESQADVWSAYKSAGISVGKVQVSSAIRVCFDELSDDERRQALAQLASFAEDRYLHQTMVRESLDAEPEFFEDLPLALKSLDGRVPERGEWRVHFHVPIYLDSFGHLKASRGAVIECLEAAKGAPEVTHFEVETYAWGVLPDALRTPSLANGIAEEMNWFRKQLS